MHGETLKFVKARMISVKMSYMKQPASVTHHEVVYCQND